MAHAPDLAIDPVGVPDATLAMHDAVAAVLGLTNRTMGSGRRASLG